MDSGWSSALILEDDADWDVSLKSQLKEFAKAAHTIESRQGTSDDQLHPHNRTSSPYGSKWDLLWLGICANPPGPADAITFPGAGGEPHFVYPVDGGTACTVGYGVTQESARLMLAHLEDTNRPTDIAMSIFCQNSDILCLVVWPMLISAHKMAGSRSKDSDIGHSPPSQHNSSETADPNGPKEEDEIREKGESWKIVNSAILDALEKSENSSNDVS